MNKTQEMPLTTRLDGNTGYICNNNCLFCYFRGRKHKLANPSTAEVKKLFTTIKRLKVDTLEITGGEPSVREDIIELISFAKKELMFKKVTIITNGNRFCDKKFAEKTIKNGIDDVLVSVHGPEAKIHDHLTDVRGSFDKAVQAIKNVLSLNVSCRTNTVVTKLNYKRSEEIARLVYNLGIRKVNYIYFSPLDDAITTQKELWCKYSESAPFIKSMIDEYKSKLETISIKVIPFCFLAGYEDCITDLYQNAYDPFEWDYYQRVRIRRNKLIRDVATIGGMFLFMDFKRVLKIGLDKSLREAILRVEAFRHCIKPKVCKMCRFDPVCPGTWKAYARQFGLTELKPVEGSKIRDIDYCLRNRFSNYYKKDATK